MSTTATVTVREFLAQSPPDGLRRELVAGEVITMGNAGFRHERAKMNILKVLILHITQHPVGEVSSETIFQLSAGDARMPDVCVLLNEQIPVPATDAPIPCAPALAVEIVSSEQAADLERKVELYLERGSRTVWVVYPEQRSVMIYEADGQLRLVRGEEEVHASCLPGFSVPASRFFEGL